MVMVVVVATVGVRQSEFFQLLVGLALGLEFCSLMRKLLDRLRCVLVECVSLFGGCVLVVPVVRNV